MSGLWETDFGTFARGSVPLISTLFDSRSETTWRHLLGERNVLGSFDVSATHYHVFGPQQDTTDRIARYFRQTLGSDPLDWFARSRRTPSFPGHRPRRIGGMLDTWLRGATTPHQTISSWEETTVDTSRERNLPRHRVRDARRGRVEKAQGLEKESRVGIKCPAPAHSPLRGREREDCNTRDKRHTCID